MNDFGQNGSRLTSKPSNTMLVKSYNFLVWSRLPQKWPLIFDEEKWWFATITNKLAWRFLSFNEKTYRFRLTLWASKFAARVCQLTCLKNMKAHFAFFTVLENQTLLMQLDWGTCFNLYLWLALFSNNFDFFSVILICKLTLSCYLQVTIL